jgi:large subunit ribosomal protein L9
MQVILMEKVVNLGGLGDVVKVKDGFARNFLIPQGKAKRATAENLKEFENRRADLEKKANEQLTGAQERAEKLEGMKIDIAQKAGVDGRLFGSVTNADIAESLGKLGLTVKKAEIRMPQGPLKHIGEFPVTLQLHYRRPRAHHGARGRRAVRLAIVCT